MYFKKILINLLSVTALFGLFSSVVNAHPGHEVANSFHAALHTEHVLIVLAIGAVIAIGAYLKQ
jgi:hypothetical protein